MWTLYHAVHTSHYLNLKNNNTFELTRLFQLHDHLVEYKKEGKCSYRDARQDANECKLSLLISRMHESLPLAGNHALPLIVRNTPRMREMTSGGYGSSGRERGSVGGASL